jgi:hypothetical protein
MTQAFNLSQFANKVNTSGEADLTTAVTGTLPQGNGGTGLTTPGTSGNVLMSDGTDWVSGTIYPVRNRIINGAMNIWQRGTSVTTSGGYTADRWTEVSGNSNQHIQSTDAPTDFGYSMQIIGIGGNINQRIESLNCQDLSGQTITISFWVKNTSGTDGLILGLYYPNTADNFGSLTQIGSNITISSNPSSSWTQYTTTFTSLPAGSKNGLSLYLARLGTGGVSTTWYLTGVQLEVGSTATPFERRLYGQELANCQRYYITVGGDQIYQNLCVLQAFGSTGANGGAIPFPVKMRAAPTLSYSSLSHFYVQNSVGSGITPTVIEIGGNESSSMCGSIRTTVSSGLSGGNASAFFTGSTSARINFSAEL